MIKRKLAEILGFLYYPIFKMKKVKINSIENTIKYMSVPGNCIIRFGDGEFSIIENKDIIFQKHNRELSVQLKNIINSITNDNLLICLPPTILSLKNINKKSRMTWRTEFFRNRKAYKENINSNYLYGNSFVSRPYMIYKNKSQADKIFSKILSLFDNQEILIVEGSLSRSGVGNNLFEKAKNVNRILCPSSDAYEKYSEILDATVKHGTGKMILVALGPTGKVLAYNLAKRGFWVLDIGHLDSEYEWYLKSADTKTSIPFKHTAETADDNIENCMDQRYLDSIIAVIE